MTSASGSKLGPYQIEAPIGTGGMGVVYRARDTRLDRTVAIKIVEGRFSERFEREAKTIASLNHPHICTLHDVGENYLVMEYIEGMPVQGPLPVNEVARLGAQIADALHAAHRQGITHRDLKPANILVTKSGVKVIDFGLAKGVSLAPDGQDVTLTKPLTGEGTILGTVPYMSPEQLHGQEADARSDVFALGCVLYEMLTGKRAFGGKSPASIMAAILEHEPVPTHVLQPITPAWLDRLIGRCLRKDPEERWQSARDIAIELHEPPGTPAPAPTASKKWPWITAAAVLASGLATYAAATYYTRRLPASTPVRFEIFPGGASGGPGATGNFPQISRDGSKVAFRATADGISRLYVRSLASVDAQLVPHSEGAVSGVFSPDGRWLAFRAEGQLRKVDLQTGAVETVADWDNRTPPFCTWGAKGILYPGPKGLTMITASGNTPEVIIPRQEGMGGTMPSFLPDGRQFLYASGYPPDQRLYLGAIDEPNSKSPRPLWPTDSMGIFAAGENGQAYVLFVRNQSLLAQRVDSSTLTPLGDPLGIVAGLPPAGSYLPVAASANGVLVYQSFSLAGPNQVSWYGRQGNHLGDPVVPGPYTSVSLSPDGARAAVSGTRSGNNSQADVWLLDLARGTSSRLTLDAAGSRSPVWTPDGLHVTFWKRGTQVTLPVGGGAGVEIGTPNRALALPYQWSRDGTKLLYSGAGQSLWVYDSNTRHAENVVASRPFNFAQAQFSPDGHWIVYASDESGSRQVYAMRYPGGSGRFQISLKGGSQPRWSRDGREVFFVADRKLIAVPIRWNGTNPEAGRPQELFDFPANSSASNAFRYDVSPDSQRFLILADPPDKKIDPITVVLNWTTTLTTTRTSAP